MLEWFIADADYNAITSNPTADIIRPAVLAYNGTVYDNVTVNIRGRAPRPRPKPNWKFEMPKNHDTAPLPGLVEPVDEFAMQADWSDKSHGRPLLAWDSYQPAGIVNTQIFPVRTQRNAAFQGLYTYVDLFDGTWRDREGYDDDAVLQGRTRRVRRDPAAGGVPVREEEPRRRRLRPHRGVPGRRGPHRGRAA